MPHIIDVCKRRPAEGVQIWDHMYAQGAKFAPPVGILSAACLFIAGYYHPYLPLPVTPFKPQNVESLDVGLQLAVAGALILSTTPITIFAMMPNIKVLRGIATKVDERSDVGITEKLALLTTEKEEILPRVERWGKHQTIRAVLYTTGFIVALAAF